jgi:hypothetical protein
MENQHRKITGYRELTKEEIDLMNRIKAIGEEFKALINSVEDHLDDQLDIAITLQCNRNDETEGTAEIKRIGQAEPHRWKAMAKTSFQEGLMFLTRAVAQPTTF